MDYNFHEIEKKWQKYWEDNKTFKTPDDLTNPKKCYILDMFPYPSGLVCMSAIRKDILPQISSAGIRE